MNLEELKCRYEETKQYKDRWLGLYQQLYSLVIPDRDAFNVKFKYRDDGKPNTDQIWDTTAVLAAYQRANDLHGLLMPSDRIWGKLEMDPHIFSLEEITNAKPTMDEINDRIFFYLNKSNLARVVNSSNLDLVGGTGAIWVESIDDNTPLYFRSIPAVTLYVEYSTDDLLNTCWYQCRMNGRQIMMMYPKYKGKMLSALRDLPNEQYTCIYGQIKLTENKFYIYAILESDPYTVLFETQRSYNQIIIYRDRVRPGESEGRGIGLDLLPTIRDLNKTVQNSIKNLDFKSNPPIFYDADSYFNPYAIRSWAGAAIPRQPGGRNPIEALEMPAYPEVLEKIRYMQDIVKQGFMVDPLGEISSPVRSATEVSIRENRAQRTSSTDISRLINELPRQVFEISAKILSERKLLTMKRDIQQFNTKKLSFSFQSPLYDLQKQDDLNHFATNLQLKQQFFGQEAAMGTCNLEKVNTFLTNKLNLPSDLFKTEDQILAYIKQAAQMSQQGQLPTPTTSAAQVKLPEQPQVTV